VARVLSIEASPRISYAAERRYCIEKPVHSFDSSSMLSGCSVMRHVLELLVEIVAR